MGLELAMKVDAVHAEIERLVDNDLVLLDRMAGRLVRANMELFYAELECAAAQQMSTRMAAITCLGVLLWVDKEFKKKEN